MSRYTPEFFKGQRTLLDKAKASKSVEPLVQFRATAVDNYPAALDEIQRLQAEVARLTAALKDAEAAEAQVAALQTALREANEDAARLASSLENDAYPFPIRRSIDEKDAALRAHRARVGVSRDEGK